MGFIILFFPKIVKYMEGQVRLSPRITEQARLRIGIHNECHVRRSPRIIQQAQLHVKIENERQRQRDVHRISTRAKQASMTETERENCNEKTTYFRQGKEKFNGRN